MKKSRKELILEDQIIDILMQWLSNDGWIITSFCKGSKRGIDILAKKGTKVFIIEAKGAKGNPEHASTKKDKFNSGQINTHFGMAIIKVLKERNKFPNAQIAIAHPEDEYIRRVLSPIIPHLKKAGIRFLWVNLNGTVME
ncbi:MAG TPA: hypothetical protein VK625_07065 [Flavitalea sp.]|nr:hypothetical protein [Flavitalea sp.]